MARLDGQDGFQKIVALKSVLEQLGKDKRFLQMFLDEARICARLVHPNVCQVFELDKAEGIHYLAIGRSAQARSRMSLRTYCRTTSTAWTCSQGSESKKPKPSATQ